MEAIKITINNFFHFNIVDSVILTIINIIIYNIIHRIFVKSMKHNSIDKKMSNKSKTYIRLMTSIMRYIFIILTILLILQMNDINVTSMLAGLGIVSVIVGLAIQDALKDIIRGFSILSDDYFAVGDIILYEGITGKVLILGLKSTKIQDIATNNIVTIANRNIEKVEKVSNAIYINVPLPYETKVEEAEKAIENIISEIEKVKDVDKAKYKGINALEDSSINYLIEIKCNPEKKLQVRRDSLGAIVKTLEKHNIQIPYQQIDVHTK